MRRQHRATAFLLQGFLFLSLLAVSAALPAVAVESRTGTLGSQGEVFLVQVGQESQLFGENVSNGDPLVLALEILRPDQEPEWIRVPESEGVNPNASYFVLYEDTSDTVFVVWEGRIGSHPIIQLAAFQDGTWSETRLVSENVWSLKGFPQLAITRESFQTETEDGEVRLSQRTLLHVVWWEETAEGDRTLYRPLVLEDGQLEAMGQAYVLNDLADEAIALDAEAPHDELLRHPRVQTGSNGQTVLVTFADDVRRKILVLEIDLLPAGLGMLGNDVFEFIAGLGPLDPEDPQLASVPGRIRSHIVIVGHRNRLNPGGVQRIADEAHSVATETLAQRPLPDLQSLAGIIRSHIVIVGARMSGETLDQFHPSADPSVLEVASGASSSAALSPEAMITYDETCEVPTFVRLTVTAELPVPALVTGKTHLFASPEGSDLVLAWETEKGVQFRKSSQGAWGPVNDIPTNPEIDLSRALELLKQSVQPGL